MPWDDESFERFVEKMRSDWAPKVVDKYRRKQMEDALKDGVPDTLPPDLTDEDVD